MRSSCAASSVSSARGGVDAGGRDGVEKRRSDGAVDA
jgi:hypothetical protein